MNTLDQIEVDITVELGAAVMPIHHLLRMGRGAIIELNATEHDPLKIYANNTLIARGEGKVEEGPLSVEVTEKILKLGCSQPRPAGRLIACTPRQALLHAASLRPRASLLPWRAVVAELVDAQR